MGGGDGRVYSDTFDSTEFGAGPSVTDHGMHHRHVADEQGASNVHPWLNHDVRVADLDDSPFQDMEDHVEANDKTHRERLSRAEGRPTAWQQEQSKGKQQRESVGHSGKNRGCGIIALHRR